jgi:transcriptional regulator with XRE-family HTH domain
MATKSLFRQTLDEIPAETHIFIQKYTDILDRVQAILERKGMKRRDLALALGKSESEVSKWLAGEHNFTLKSLAKLEAVLGEEILVVAAAGSSKSNGEVATAGSANSEKSSSKASKKKKAVSV